MLKLRFTFWLILLLCIGSFTHCEKYCADEAHKSFRLWATADAHVQGGLNDFGRESLAEAIEQSEFGGRGGEPSFEWDVMLHLGDLVGKSAPPNDQDGIDVLKQFLSVQKHKREQIYNLLGNHDSSVPGEPTQWWFQKWVDPLGERTHYSRVHADRRPYPITGTWERYSFQVGNILILMMGDRNDLGPPSGRLVTGGGFPAGAVTQETFEWWVRMVEENQDKIIISCHHHMLKNTTVASGEWEAVEAGYHTARPKGAPKGASYLYFVGGKPDAQAFENYLENHPGAIDLWLGAHTHTNPDDTHGGKSHVEQKWGVTFVNVAALALHWGRRHTTPMSRLLTFQPGSAEVNIQCYLHTSHYAAQGWYEPAQRVMPLRHQFQWQ